MDCDAYSTTRFVIIHFYLKYINMVSELHKIAENVFREYVHILLLSFSLPPRPYQLCVPPRLPFSAYMVLFL